VILSCVGFLIFGATFGFFTVEFRHIWVCLGENKRLALLSFAVSFTTLYDLSISLFYVCSPFSFSIQYPLFTCSRFVSHDCISVLSLANSFIYAYKVACLSVLVFFLTFIEFPFASTLHPFSFLHHSFAHLAYTFCSNYGLLILAFGTSGGSVWSDCVRDCVRVVGIKVVMLVGARRHLDWCLLGGGGRKEREWFGFKALWPLSCLP